MDHCQLNPEDDENNYFLLGIEESAKYSIAGRMMAETNDDYADPDEEGKGWDQDSENVYHVLEGPATTEGEGPTQNETTVYEVPVPSRPPKNN